MVKNQFKNDEKTKEVSDDESGGERKRSSKTKKGSRGGYTKEPRNHKCEECGYEFLVGRLFFLIFVVVLQEIVHSIAWIEKTYDDTHRGEALSMPSLW